MGELEAMFWQHRVILKAPDPHGGPSRVIMDVCEYVANIGCLSGIEEVC